MILFLLTLHSFFQIRQKEGCFFLTRCPVCCSPPPVLLLLMEDVLHHVSFCWSITDFNLYISFCARYVVVAISNEVLIPNNFH